jgi:hypothetical protein
MNLEGAIIGSTARSKGVDGGLEPQRRVAIIALRFGYEVTDPASFRPAPKQQRDSNRDCPENQPEGDRSNQHEKHAHCRHFLTRLSHFVSIFTIF